MKKLRIFLALSALLLAIGGTLASNNSLNEYFEPIQDDGDWICNPHQVSYTCSPGMGEACKVGFELRQVDDPNISPRCGAIVTKD